MTQGSKIKLFVLITTSSEYSGGHPTNKFAFLFTSDTITLLFIVRERYVHWKCFNLFYWFCFVAISQNKYFYNFTTCVSSLKAFLARLFNRYLTNDVWQKTNVQSWKEGKNWCGTPPSISPTLYSRNLEPPSPRHSNLKHACAPHKASVPAERSRAHCMQQLQATDLLRG